VQKYRGFRLANRLLKILAWVELIFGIIASLIGGMASAKELGGVAALIIIVGILYSVIAWIITLASADIFEWLPDIEEDIRRIASSK